MSYGVIIILIQVMKNGLAIAFLAATLLRRGEPHAGVVAQEAICPAGILIPLAPCGVEELFEPFFENLPLLVWHGAAEDSTRR